MLKLKLGKKVFRLPYKQSEITHSTGLALDNLVEEYTGGTSNIEFQKWFIAILLNKDYDFVDQIDTDQLSLLVKEHAYFLPIQIKYFPHILKIKHKLYEYIDLNNINVRTFGELDIKANEKDFEVLHTLLYKQLKYKFKYIFLKNYKNWGDINHYEHYLAIINYLNYKKELLDSYRLNAIDKDIPAEQQPDEYKQQGLELWGIYHIIMNITGDNYSEFEKWLNRDIHELLKFVKYNQLQALENQQNNPS